MKKRNYLSDVEDRSGNAFSVIADFEGNEEQLMDIEVEGIVPWGVYAGICRKKIFPQIGA